MTSPVDTLKAALIEARRWIGDGDLADGLHRDHWTPRYRAAIDMIDATLADAAIAALSDDTLADTQRAIIEAAERRGYDRGLRDAALSGGEAEPVAWLRMQPDGSPDWAEDCIGSDNKFLDPDLEADGYCLRPLAFADAIPTTPRIPDGKEPVAWRESTPYGVGYNFASEEVMRDMAGWLTATPGDEGNHFVGAQVTPGGTVVIDPETAVRGLQRSGVLDRAREHMRIGGAPINSQSADSRLIVAASTGQVPEGESVPVTLTAGDDPETNEPCSEILGVFPAEWAGRSARLIVEAASPAKGE